MRKEVTRLITNQCWLVRATAMFRRLVDRDVLVVDSPMLGIDAFLVVAFVLRRAFASCSSARRSCVLVSKSRGLKRPLALSRSWRILSLLRSSSFSSSPRANAATGFFDQNVANEKEEFLEMSDMSSLPRVAAWIVELLTESLRGVCLLYTSPSPRD